MGGMPGMGMPKPTGSAGGMAAAAAENAAARKMKKPKLPPKSVLCDVTVHAVVTVKASGVVITDSRSAGQPLKVCLCVCACVLVCLSVFLSVSVCLSHLIAPLLLSLPLSRPLSRLLLCLALTLCVHFFFLRSLCQPDTSAPCFHAFARCLAGATQPHRFAIRSLVALVDFQLSLLMLLFFFF